MRTVVYARTSTLDQAREEKVSIPDQITWAKTFTLERAWEWLGEYIEPGVFGDVEPEQREAMNRMIQDARRDKFDIVLVYHSSRFAREPDIGMRACRLLGQIRKQVYFRNSPIEPLLPDKFSWGANIGSMYMTAFSFIGDFQENVARSERVRSGFQGLAKRGKLVFAPYGYKKISKMITDEMGRLRYDWYFEIEPSEVLIVQRIFHEYVSEGGSIRRIMLSLNKDGIYSPTGKKGMEGWSAQTIKNILTDPAYIGEVRWGRKLGGKYLQGKTSSGKQRRIFASPDKWIIRDGDHPKIITNIEIFHKVQEKLKLRYNLKGRAVASPGLLTGLVFCGRCSRKAYFKTSFYKKRKYIRSNYVCQSYFRHKSCKRHIISKNKLHDIVISEIDKIAANPHYREKLLTKNSNTQTSYLKEKLDLLKKERKQIEGKQQRILMAYESGNLPLPAFGEARRRLDDEAIRIINEIENIERTLLDTSRAIETKKKFLDILKNFKVYFKKVEFIKQKEILQNLIQSIFVKGSRIVINYRI